MQIRKITKYLLEKYPLDNKEIWDPSGFSVKFNLSEKLRGVVVALDLTSEVINKALQINANLIITHHPFKFEETWEDEQIKAPYKEKILQILKAKRINVIACHTNYDNDINGTSHQIVNFLNLDKFKIKYEKQYPCLIQYSTTPNNIINLINSTFGYKSFRTNIDTNNMNTIYNKIAFLSGSGYVAEINKLNSEGIDLFITSDIKWSDWIVYKETNAKIIEIPHLDEEVFTYDIYKQLKTKFHLTNIEIVKIDELYINITK
ncbi:Nif3-like dinuclear metal center hexameric protein [Mycoplasmopsis lipofaciens]|uniref:Nif3-like dinuclear metal center hexameric protein n=1 Tax=Mycoplasmopsis lipofaciens TaxID=114884 RepID=UPI00048A0AB8|nr:Nif3-like dinuclear metal center hexameric protein [Mycoplasmopsis lipofaciens]